MASNKVTLRTGLEGDVFVMGDVQVTHTGTEFPSRTAADEALEAARLAGTRLYEVPAEEPDAKKNTATKTEGGNG